MPIHPSRFRLKINRELAAKGSIKIDSGLAISPRARCISLPMENEKNPETEGRASYAGSTFALLTKRAKESEIAPRFQQAPGASVTLGDSFDTDTLGSFTRDVPRFGSQLDAARKKAELAIELSGFPCGFIRSQFARDLEIRHGLLRRAEGEFEAAILQDFQHLKQMPIVAAAWPAAARGTGCKGFEPTKNRPTFPGLPRIR